MTPKQKKLWMTSKWNKQMNDKQMTPKQIKLWKQAFMEAVLLMSVFKQRLSVQIL